MVSLLYHRSCISSPFKGILWLSGMSQVFMGQIVHSLSTGSIEILNGFLAVANGKITAIGSNYEEWKANCGEISEEIHLSRTQFIMPGFVDCHIHASQMPNIGLGIDQPLLKWLEDYTFPTESRFNDTSLSQRVYQQVVSNTICSGTTLAAYFATNHKDSSLILATELIKQGQRAFVGKVSSDCNAPAYYVETLCEAIDDAEDFVKCVIHLGSELVRPIITPRFAVTCTNALMSALSELSDKYDVKIQSHISENLKEIEIVKKIFGKSYAKVYQDAGLLRKDKCILAHAIYLDDEELSVLHSTGTSIAHCPSSNTNLGSGLCNIQRIIKAGIKVGLGTDVSGGSSASILDAIRRCLDVSKHISLIKNQLIETPAGNHTFTYLESYKAISFQQAFYLATLGGAEALHVDDIVGNFIVGKSFDALLIESSNFPIFNANIETKIENQENYVLKLLQKFIYTGDDRNILRVFVEGKQIK